MIKTFMLIAFRNLLKDKTISFIKITGLAIGLAAVFLIYIYAKFEYSYDNYHANGDRIYRMAYHVSRPNLGKYDECKTGNNLAPMLQNYFPEIELTTRVSWMGEVDITQKNQRYKETKFMFADPSVLSMFSFPMRQGDRSTALNDPKSILVSSRIAKKYFGDENPVGRFLDDNKQFVVTGVIDVPDNSHFRFDILASYDALSDVFPFCKNSEGESIGVTIYTYLMLKENANYRDMENKLAQFADTHLDKGNYASLVPFLEPLTKINLESSADGYYGEFSLSKFTKPLIYLFVVLGIIIISIACFNFVNIAIAQIVGRTREVGVRKVFGSKKSEIFLQFVCEYGLYSFLAVLVSMLIVQIALPQLSSMLNRHIHINYLGYFVTTLFIMLLVTALSGTYPSLLIARINTVSALHNGLKGSRGNALRSFLVTSQFTVSIILILTSFYIAKQINYLTEMNIGLNAKDVLVVKMERPENRKGYEQYKSELLRNPSVLSVSASSNIPAVSGAGWVKIQVAGKEPVSLALISIDPGFTKNLGISIISGRNFDEGSQAGSKSSFLLNKKAVEMLGINNPVGEGIALSAYNDEKNIPFSSGQVIGVIDDYSYRPNYDDSKGVVFNYNPDQFNAMFIHMDPDNQKETLAMIENTWMKLFPDIPFNANFLTNEIKSDVFILKLYSLQRFIAGIAIFSLFIALLGLFGLSLFDVRLRIKEIGVRRVNGATMKELLVAMNRKFISLVIISVIISFPFVFFIIETIKRDSAKSTELSLTNYGIAFLLIVTLTVLTVSWQSWKAASRNPVEALRYE